jgi:hypothetical protein
MNKLALCVAAAALASCGQGQPAGPDRQVAQPEPHPTTRAAPGTYSVTEIDGTKVTTVLAADHTYSNTIHGRRSEVGAWSIVGGKACFTPSEGVGAQARCYNDGRPAKDGSFIATPDKGEPITVKKIA